MTDPSTVERLKELLAKVAKGGPHEWGYRDLITGKFVHDDWPFEVADSLPEILTALGEAQERAEAAEPTPKVYAATVRDLNLVRPDSPVYWTARNALDCITAISVAFSNARAERDALKFELAAKTNECAIADEQIERLVAQRDSLAAQVERMRALIDDELHWLNDRAGAWWEEAQQANVEGDKKGEQGALEHHAVFAQRHNRWANPAVLSEPAEGK